jgi:predicted nucleic acid-binding protein
LSEYVLDTNIVLHYTRQTSPVAAQVEADYHIRKGRLRPMVCVVSLGEIRAFAREWALERVALLENILGELLIIDINRDDVIREHAQLHKFSTDGKELAGKSLRGRNISHNDLWIAAAARAVDAAILTTDLDLLRLPTGTVKVIQVNSQTGVTENRRK